MPTLYEILGIEKDATQDQIKRAYRKRAQETHPDKQGGSNEAFQAVQQAYEVLSNEAARKRYDETGRTSDEPTNAEKLLLMLFGSLIDDEHFEGDYITETRSRLKAIMSELKTHEIKVRRDINHFDRLLKRIAVNAKNQNLFVALLESKLAGAKEVLSSIPSKIAAADEAMNLLAAYADTKPYVPTSQFPQGLMGMGGMQNMFGQQGFGPFRGR